MTDETIKRIRELIEQSQREIDARDAGGARWSANEALELARAEGRQDLVAEAISKLAMVAIVDGSVPDGLAMLERAIALYDEADEPDEAAAMVFVAVHLHRRLGNSDRAVELYHRLIGRAGALDDTDVEPGVRTELADYYRELDQPAKALDELQAAWDVVAAHDEPSGEVMGRVILVTTGAHLDLGDVDAAREAAERGMSEAKASDDDAALALAHAALGDVALETDDIDAMLHHYRAAASLPQSDYSQVVTLHRLAVALGRAGRLDEAFEQLDASRALTAQPPEGSLAEVDQDQQVQEVTRAITQHYALRGAPEGGWPDAPGVASLIRRGERELERDNPDRARRPLEQAAERARRAGDIPHLAQALAQLSKAHAALVELESASDVAYEAAELYGILGDRRREGLAWLAAARTDVSEEEEEGEAARDYAERAVACFREVGDHAGVARALQAKAEVYLAREDIDTLIALYDEAQESAERSDDEVLALDLLIERAGILQHYVGADAAREALAQAYERAAAARRWEEQVRIITLRATLYQQDGDHAKALAEYEQAYDLLREHNALNSQRAIATELGLGRVLLRLGDDRAGRRYLRHAERLARQHGDAIQQLTAKLLLEIGPDAAVDLLDYLDAAGEEDEDDDEGEHR